MEKFNEIIIFKALKKIFKREVCFIFIFHFNSVYDLFKRNKGG
nr:hypothetical protein [Mycoplasmopsis bovis]